MSRLRTTHWRVAAALITAVALGAILVSASMLGAGERTSEPGGTPPVTSEPSLFSGLEQRGVALGSPRAPVTLVEYADLQCPYCAQWALNTLPTLVDDYVRKGELRLVFRGLAFLGADSDEALRAALAAGRENHLWDVVHRLYQNQGQENTGWVTDDLIGEIADSIPGLDGERLLAARWERPIEAEMELAAAAAEAAGVRGTPSFEIGRTGGRLELVAVSSLGPEGIVPSIERLLAR